MFRPSLLMIFLFLSSTNWAQSDLETSTSNLLMAIESPLRVGDMPLACTAGEVVASSSERPPRVENPIEVLGAEVDFLATLFSQVEDCKKAKKEDEACKSAFKNLENQITLLRHNYKNKKGVGLSCTTLNDNSLLKVNKDKTMAGSGDEGATAQHKCRLSLFLGDKGVIHTALSSSLFTDIKGEITDPNSEFDYEQLTLDRTQLEALYEWNANTKTKLGLGAYVSKLERGGESFGAKLQHRWHEMNGFVTYEDITPEADLGAKYGGGIIGTVERVMLEKDYRHFEFKSVVNARIETGIEDSKFRFQGEAGFQNTARGYLTSKNKGPYLEVGAGAKLETTQFGGENGTALYIGGEGRIGYKAKNLDIHAGISQYDNILYKGPGFTDAEILSNTNNQTGESFGNLSTPVTKPIQQFGVTIGAKYTFGNNKKNKKEQQAYREALEFSVMSLQSQYEQEEDPIEKNIIQKKLERKIKELDRLK